MGVKQPLATSPVRTMQPHPDLEKFFSKYKTRFNEFIYQIKYDGVRCLFDAENLEFYSRAHKLYPNFGKFVDECVTLVNELGALVGQPIHLDGEVAGPTFTNIMENLFAKSDVDLTGIHYYVFDFTAEGWEFRHRDGLLKQVFASHNFTTIKPVFTHSCPKFQSLNEMESFIRRLEEEGYEGCVFKRYHGDYLFGSKRQGEWVKGILDETLDLPCFATVEGTGKLKGCVGKFLCDLPNGEVVAVAPGRATHAQLKMWWEEQYVPPMIETYFKGWTKDGKSLRHPRFIRTREDKCK